MKEQIVSSKRIGKNTDMNPTDKYMNGKDMEPEIKKFFHAQFLYKNKHGITFVDGLKFFQ